MRTTPRTPVLLLSMLIASSKCVQLYHRQVANEKHFLVGVFFLRRIGFFCSIRNMFYYNSLQWSIPNRKRNINNFDQCLLSLIVFSCLNSLSTTDILLQLTKWNDQDEITPSNLLFDWLWTKAKHTKLDITCCVYNHPSLTISSEYMRALKTSLASVTQKPTRYFSNTETNNYN